MKALFGDTSLKLQVLENPNGACYIGRLDEDGAPYARDSTEYFESRGMAEKALEDGDFVLRDHP